MSPAGGVRIAAFALACLVVSAALLAGNAPARQRQVARSAQAAWRAPLVRADAALASGDARRARQAWEEAYRLAIHARDPEGLLAVGHFSLRIGEATHEGQSSVAEARRNFLAAMFQARERRDAEGVARAGEAFDELGDRDVADRAFAVALALASQSRDAGARENVSGFVGRADWDRRGP